MASRSLDITITVDPSGAVQGFADVGAATDATSGSFEGLAAVAESVGAAIEVAAAAIGAALVAAGVAALQMGDEFTQAYNQISNQTGATGAELDGLRDSLANVVGQTPNSVMEAATAIGTLHVALQAAGQPLNDLSVQMLNLARITGTDVGETVRGAADLFKTWGISVQDAAGVLDYLFAASQQAGIGINDLTGSLNKNSQILQEFGFSVQQSASMVTRLSEAGIDQQDVFTGLNRLAANFSKDASTNMGHVATATTSVESATKSLIKAQENLYDLNERLAAQSQISLEDDQQLRKAQEAIADAQISADRARRDSAEKVSEAQQNLLDLQQRLAASGQLDVGDEQSLRKAQDAIKEAESLDLVKKAEQALADLRQRQKGHRPDVSDQQALRKAQEAVTEAQQKETEKRAAAQQTLIDLQERLNAKGALSVSDQQQLVKAQQAIGKAQENAGDAQADATKKVEDAQQNLVDLQDRLSEKTKLSISDQQQLRRANEAVAEAQDKAGKATNSLASAQGAALAAPKSLRAALDSVFDAIRNAPTDEAALEIAIKNFGGKLGPKLAEEIRKHGLKVEDLIGPLDVPQNAINNAAAATEDWRVKWDKLVNRIKETVGPKVADAIKPVVGLLADIGNWLLDKLPIAADELKKEWDKYWPSIEPLITPVKDALVAAAGAVSTVFTTLSENQDVMDAFKDTLIIVGAVLAGAMVVGLLIVAALIASIVIPIVAVVAAITGMILIMEWCWDRTKEVWNLISNAVAAAWNWIVQTGQTAWNDLVDGFNWVKDNAVRIFHSVTDFLSGIWDGVGRAASGTWQWVVDSAYWAYNEIAKLPSKIWNALNGMWDIVSSGFKAALNYVIDLWNWFAKSFRVPEVNVGGITVGGWSVPTIPKLHTGGIFEAAAGHSEGLALLRDGERVMTPSQASSQSAVAPPDSGGGNINIYVNVDGTVVHDDRALMKYMAAGMSEFKRTGGRGPWS